MRCLTVLYRGLSGSASAHSSSKIPTQDQQIALCLLMELAVQRGSLGHILSAVLLLLNLWNNRWGFWVFLCVNFILFYLFYFILFYFCNRFVIISHQCAKCSLCCASFSFAVVKPTATEPRKPSVSLLSCADETVSLVSFSADRKGLWKEM